MRTETTGRVRTEMTIENLGDLWAAERNLLPRDQVRSVVVKDAAVDKETTLLALPRRLIEQLGLTPLDKRVICRVGSSREATIYQAVRVTILGRDCTTDVTESPDDACVVVGRIVLLALDLVPDCAIHSLIGNPAHGGQQVLEAY